MAIFNRLSPSDLALFEKKVVRPYMDDVLVNSKFAKFSGNSPTAMIYSVMQNKGEGERIVFPVHQVYFPTVVFDETQLAGTGDGLVVSQDGLIIGENRFAISLTSQQMAEIEVAIDTDMVARTQLATKGKLIHTCKIMNQFGLAFVGDTVRPNYHYFYHYRDWATHIIPNMLACSINDGAQPSTISSDRVIFGQDRVAQATVTASIATARLTSADDDALTVDHIYKLSDLAIRGSRIPSSEESALVPYESASRWGFDAQKFVLFTSPSAFNRLRLDPEWAAQTTRGVVEVEGQPSVFYQGMYKGTVYGVMVIVLPEWENYTFLNADGERIAYSALCGQGAIVHGMGGMPRLTIEDNDHKKKHELGMATIDAMKVLKYASKSSKLLKQDNPIKLERGIIHSFTRIT